MCVSVCDIFVCDIMCVCICVCGREGKREREGNEKSTEQRLAGCVILAHMRARTHAHTHTQSLSLKSRLVFGPAAGGKGVLCESPAVWSVFPRG